MERRKEVGRLDIENPKCKWQKSLYERRQDYENDSRRQFFARRARTARTADEITYSTAYDVAERMGNTNGFENQSDV